MKLRLATLTVPALFALGLAACSGTGGSSVAPVVDQPSQTVGQAAAQRANSDYEMSIQGANGELERAHVFKPNGTQKAGGTSNLAYGGGPIQAHPKIYIVFWQFGSGADPSGEQSLLTSFMNGVGGSSWLNIDSQYYGPVGTFVGNPSGQLAGTWVDTTNSIPRRVSSSAIASEAVRAVAHFGYSADAAYIVATPHGHNTSGFGSQFCAWHSSTSSSSGPVAYTNLPYITDAGASCGANFNGLGANAGITIVSGHELAETQTDPQPNSGWVDSSGAEIGDKCAWVSSGAGASANIHLSTGTFPVQTLWDNAKNGCQISGP